MLKLLLAPFRAVALVAFSLVGSALMVGAASAQSAIDPTAVTDVITANEGTITTIGTAILGLVVLIAAYRWVRRIIK